MNQFGSKFIQTCKTSRKQGETGRFTNLVLFHNSPLVRVRYICIVKWNSMRYLTGLIPTLPPWSRNGVALRQADTISFNACISACEGLGFVAVKLVNRLDNFFGYGWWHKWWIMIIAIRYYQCVARWRTLVVGKQAGYCRWTCDINVCFESSLLILIRLWVVLWVDAVDTVDALR